MTAKKTKKETKQSQSKKGDSKNPLLTKAKKMKAKVFRTENSKILGGISAQTPAPSRFHARPEAKAPVVLNQASAKGQISTHKTQILTKVQTSKAKAFTEKTISTNTATALAEPSPEEREELEEQQESAAHAAAEGGNEAALAAAGSTEISASSKNFRHHPDMENFYRFIYENDLRHEALAIIDEIMLQKHQRKLLRVAKTQSH